MPETQLPNQKKNLRDEARRKRFQLTPEDIREKSARICIRALSLIAGSNTVMVYCAKSPEVETTALISLLMEEKKRIVVPIIEKETTTLRLSYVTDPCHLVESTFRVPEPVGNEQPAQAGDVDVVIVPMLAFDRAGNRLGYGAGYYDRFLSAHPGIRKIGLAFSCQETPSVPADENDIRMDFIVTEDGVLHCGSRK